MAEIWEPKIIREKKLLLVEGQDEKNFFDAFFEHLQIAHVQIESVAGKNHFADRFPKIIKAPGFSQVEIMAIIRDAEGSATATFQSMADILSKHGLQSPLQHAEFVRGIPSVGIFIMPGYSEKGMLEDLCLKTVSRHPAMKCVTQFAKCVKKLPNPPKVMAKAKSQAFLAAMPEIVNSVGLGAKNRYWNFDSKSLSNLKKFLAKLKE